MDLSNIFAEDTTFKIIPHVSFPDFITNLQTSYMFGGTDVCRWYGEGSVFSFCDTLDKVREHFSFYAYKDPEVGIKDAIQGMKRGVSMMMYDDYILWALATKHETAEMWVDRIMESYCLSHKYLYVILKYGHWREDMPSPCDTKGYMIMYGFGKLTLQDVMDMEFQEKGKVLGLMSHDYPVEVYNYTKTLTDRHIVWKILKTAFMIRSRMSFLYVRDHNTIPNMLLHKFKKPEHVFGYLMEYKNFINGL